MAKGSYYGQSVVEYGLIIAAIAIIVMLGLSNVGNSLTELFSKSSDALTATSSGVSSSQNNQPGGRPSATSIRDYAKAGTGYYTVVTDPDTGKPKLMTMTESGQPTNITSIDGNQFNALGSTMIANTLRQRAEAETDPELKSYYTKLANNAYYMGAIEGTLDGMSQFSFESQYGNRTMALYDFEWQKSGMKHLIDNPPAGLDEQTYASIMPLAAEVYNIGQHYDLTHNYSTNNNGSIEYRNPLDVGKNIKGMASINQVTTLDELKSISAQVLSDNKVESVPVEVTLTDATLIDKHASKPQKRD